MPHRSRSTTVCVPFVRGMLRDETHREVLRQRRRAQLCELPADRPTAYARLLIERITPERATIIVEHDVIPPPHALDNLARCRHAWCTHPMRHGGVRKDDLLGLAAFKPWLFTLRPRWVECALLGGLGSYRWPHWRSLDTLIARYLRHHGIQPHVHRPDAVHLHYPDPEWTPWCGWPLLTPDDVNPHMPGPGREETPAEVSPAGVPSDVSVSVGGARGLDHPEDDRRDDHRSERRTDGRERPEDHPDGE